MAEGTGLENRHTCEPGIESSNLSLSVPALANGSTHARRRAPTSARRWFAAAAFALGVAARVAAQPTPGAPTQAPAATRPALLGVYDVRSGDPIQGAIVRDTLGAQAMTSADGVVALTYINAIGP